MNYNSALGERVVAPLQALETNMVELDKYRRDIFAGDMRWKRRSGSLLLYLTLADRAFFAVRERGLRRIFRDPAVSVANGPWITGHLVTSWVEGTELVVSVQLDGDELPEEFDLDLEWRGHGTRRLEVRLR